MGENNLDKLLDMWQAAFDNGRDISVDELCRHCPELAPELERRIQVLRLGARLVRYVGTSSVESNPSADLTASLHGDTTPLPPRLGVYRILGRLGGGGMGDVYRAEETALGREVAIKVMRAEVAARPGYRERFLREARTAAKVRHDNVVPIYFVGEERGTIYIVMPVLEGESLEHRLSRGGALPANEAARIGREAAQGLAAAHDQGLVHRDVKPANLWLESPSGRVKVLDFGLAREIEADDGLTQPGGVFGSPAYMAPEQANGDQIDHRADLFGLGAVLYRCLTGVAAFQGKTVTSILRAVVDQHPLPPHVVNPNVPELLSKLVMRMLAKNPADRPSSALEVAHELALFSTSLPGGETTANWVPPAERAAKARRRRVLIMSGVVLAVGLSIAIAIWQWPRSGGSIDDTTANPSQVPSVQTTSLGPYKGQVDVQLARTQNEPLARLNVFGSLPMRQADTFRIEVEVDPPAYVYVVWVDPGHDVTPVYPWNPSAQDQWNSRPAKEEMVSKLSLPRNAGVRYRAPKAQPGVATIVMFARPTPLDVPDAEVKRWFEGLPDLPLPPGGETGVVWFDNYVETKDANRLRAGFSEVISGNEFARWQAQLQKWLQPHAAFQTAISFARTGNP